MCHDDYAPLGAIVLSPWQTKVNSYHTFPIQLYGEGLVMRQSIKFAQKSIATKPTIVDMIKAYTVFKKN